MKIDSIFFHCSFPGEKPAPYLTSAFLLCAGMCVLPFLNVGALIPQSMPPVLTICVLLFLLQGGFLLSVFLPWPILHGGSFRGAGTFLWLEKPEKKDVLFVLKTVLPLFAAISIFSALLTFLGKLCGTPEPEQVLVRIAVTSDWSVFLVIAFSAVCLAPFTEELVFRRIFYSFFRTANSGIASMIFASILFAFVHASPWQIPAFFALAIVFQAACLKGEKPSATRSILLHGAYNFCSVSVMIFIRLTGIGLPE